MAEFQGFHVIRKSDDAELARWTAVPGRIDLPNGDVLFSAEDGWESDDYRIKATTWTELDPVPPVQNTISDRQFFQALALAGEITEQEALDAVKTGAIPARLQGFIETLPLDQQFAAEMLVSGATTFDRTHPMTAALAAGMGWSEDQINALWQSASQM